MLFKTRINRCFYRVKFGEIEFIDKNFLSRQKYVDFYRSIALNLSKLRSTEVNSKSSTNRIEQRLSFLFSSQQPMIPVNEPMSKKQNVSSMTSLVRAL